MGTQQILLIVLSVIIVGIAVAVGITMFNAQATNSNRQAVMSDMNNLASSCFAFYKTPASHGGAGSAGWVVLDDLGNWLGYEWDGAACTTGNGVFTITITDSDHMTIVGVGTEIGNDGSDNVQGTVVLTGSTSNVAATIDN